MIETSARVGFRVSEVCEMLNVPETTVWGWIKSGALPATKIGGLWFVPRIELETRLRTLGVPGAWPSRGYR
jgi:excisionase family DNA binding protein